jgi:predicted metal-dependent phosphoesterase TrpH
MTVADLHVHTTNSDGTLTLETLAPAAERADLAAVAVTDHDRLHPDLADGVSTLDGITVIHGIELRVETPVQRIDLLGYGVERTDDLQGLVEHLQTDRVERARAIVECVEDRLGVDLAVPFEPGVGRPHIARAIADSEADVGYDDAFDGLIGDGDPCYVSRDIPPFADGARILSGACDVVGLAHPFRYPHPETALEWTRELDAVEVAYPYSREVDVEPAARIAREHDLLVTGGSDAHDETLGLAGLDGEAFEQFRRSAGI